MDTLLIERQTSGPDGTFGKVTFGEWSCFSLERHPLECSADHPCIPAGTYQATLFNSPRFGKKLYRLKAVPGRDYILIHPANLASELLGCIALGMRLGSLKGKPAILESKVAIQRFMALAGGKEITVEVR